MRGRRRYAPQRAHVGCSAVADAAFGEVAPSVEDAPMTCRVSANVARVGKSKAEYVDRPPHCGKSGSPLRSRLLHHAHHSRGFPHGITRAFPPQVTMR